MEALEVVRACDPPDWYIGGGAIRTIVWDQLHGYTRPNPLAGVALGFFDPLDRSPGRDGAVEAQLHSMQPEVSRQAKNQMAERRA